MPRLSLRAKILRDLRELVNDRKQAAILRQQYIGEHSDYDSDIALMENIIDARIIDAEQYLLSQRYFFRTKKIQKQKITFQLGRLNLLK